MARWIGVKHRVKKTAEGESRPTLIAILDQGKEVEYGLETETDELDFLLGRFPTSFRQATEGEKTSIFLNHQFKKHGDKILVPVSFDGLRPDDVVATIMGGSGGRLVYALTRQAKRVGAKIMWLPPFELKRAREEVTEDKEHDHRLLAHLVSARPDLLREVSERDLIQIRLRESQFARIDAMKARIACEQRLRQRTIGRIFLTDEGLYPEGLVEDVYDGIKASDVILKALIEEENTREKEVKRLVREHAAWPLLNSIEGCGELIAVRIITAVGDIRCFPTADQFVGFCGVYARDGQLIRRRVGQVANWHPELRQAFFLLAEQFNRRPNSVWGKKLRECKARLKERHPEPVENEKGILCYTPGHIHKMARWRTITRFAQWLWRNWRRFEETGVLPVPSADNDPGEMVRDDLPEKVNEDLPSPLPTLAG